MRPNPAQDLPTKQKVTSKQKGGLDGGALWERLSEGFGGRGVVCFLNIKA